MRDVNIFLFFKNFFKKFYFQFGILLSTLLVAFLDLYSKKAVKTIFHDKCDALFLKSYKIGLYYKCKIDISEFLRFSYVENYGMIFGILSNFKHIKFLVPLFTLIPIIFIFFMIYKIKKDINFSLVQKRIQILFLSIILGGGIGNIIDRFFNGFVFDFIDVYYKHYHWYTFNVADCFICLGIAGFIIFDLFLLNKKKK